MRSAWLLTTLAILLAPPLIAQDEMTAEDLATEWGDFREGKYDRLEASLKEFSSELPEDAELAYLHGLYLLTRGRLEEVRERLQKPLAAHADDLRLQQLQGESDAASGLYEAALVRLEKCWGASPPMLRAGRLRAECLAELGRREASVKAYEEVLRHGTRNVIRGGEELYELGKCYVAKRLFRQASECFVDGAKESPENPAPYAALGALYKYVYNDSPGYPNPREALEDALDLNPLHLEANYTLFELYGDNFKRDQSKREKWLANLRRVDASYPPLLLRQAKELITDRRFEASGEKIQAALRVNPHLRRSRSLEAAHAYLTGEKEKFERIEEELLKADPEYGEFYETLGIAIVDLYRFADAVPYLKKAVELDSSLVMAHVKLGQALANTGDLEGGLAAFEKSEKALPGILHPWRHNTMLGLERLSEQYTRVEKGDFIFYLHPDGRALLEEYLTPVYQEGLEVLSRKYGIRPELPIHVQVFRKFEDFSSRTVGFTGFGALGVCFGNTITAVSPLAKEFRGSFCWKSTAWHEFNHSITLALSAARIPRWLTEGLSTYEEKLLHPGYDRHLEVDLVNAYYNGDIYPIETINSAFRGPRIIFGYYQGGLICQFLAREYSFDRIAQMVKLYGEDRSTREIFEVCFGITPEEFDQRFLAYVEDIVDDIHLVPSLSSRKRMLLRERFADDPNDAEAGEILAWDHFRLDRLVDAELMLKKVLKTDPRNGRAWLLRGRLLFRREKEEEAREAIEKGFALGGREFGTRLAYGALLRRNGELEKAEEQYRKAIEDFPTFADVRRSPRLVLYQMLKEQEREEEAYLELVRYCEIDGTAFGPRVELAEYLVREGQLAEASKYYEEANAVELFSRKVHMRWGDVLKELGRYPEARREYRAARSFDLSLDAASQGNSEVDPEAWGIEGVTTDEEFRAESFAREAEVFHAEGQTERARKALLEAQELNPKNSRALQLLEALGGE